MSPRASGSRADRATDSAARREAADRADDATLGVDEGATAVGAGAGARDDEGADADATRHGGSP